MHNTQNDLLIPKLVVTKPKQVTGDYESFSDVIINCLQFVEHQPVHARLRVVAAKRYQDHLRLSISGRAGRAECFLSNKQQVDDLIERLQFIKKALFSVKLEG